jgi:hypothetical protein
MELLHGVFVDSSILAKIRLSLDEKIQPENLQIQIVCWTRKSHRGNICIEKKIHIPFRNLSRRVEFKKEYEIKKKRCIFNENQGYSKVKGSMRPFISCLKDQVVTVSNTWQTDIPILNS